MRYRMGVLIAVICFCAACAGSGDDAKPAPKTASVTELKLPDPVSSDSAKRTKLGRLEASQWGISGEPDNLIEAFGSVWTKTDSGKVLRIDPDDGAILQSIDTGYSDLPACLGFGADRTGLWACAGENRLVRIDPRNGEVSKPLTVSRIGDQYRLVSTQEGLWVVKADGRSLSALDESGRVTKTVKLGAFCSDLAVGDGGLWVVCPSDNVVIRIDPVKGRVTKKLGIAEPRQARVDGSHLWVGFADGLAQVDTSSDSVDAVYPTGPGLEGAVWTDEGDVWVRATGDDFLTRIDPAEHTITDIIEAPKLQSGGDVIVVDGAVWATANDDSTVVKLAPAR